MTPLINPNPKLYPTIRDSDTLNKSKIVSKIVIGDKKGNLKIRYSDAFSRKVVQNCIQDIL